MKIELCNAPSGFKKYVGPKKTTDGWVDVDLGEWFVNGNLERFHMRIAVNKLPSLIEKIMDGGRRENNGFHLQGGAFEVFKCAKY